MLDVEDWIYNAIQIKYQSEMMERLSKQKAIYFPSDPSMISLGDQVRLQVTAFASAYFDKEAQELIVEAHGSRNDPKKSIHHRATLGKHAFKEAKDVGRVVDYLLEGMRHGIIEMMIKQIASDNPNQTPTE